MRSAFIVQGPYEISWKLSWKAGVAKQGAGSFVSKAGHQAKHKQLKLKAGLPPGLGKETHG